MFGKNTEAAPAGGKHTQSILQEGVFLRGEFDAKGDVRLDGRLDGKIKVSERLTIGAAGRLEADIEAGEVIVMGEVKGTIRAQRRLEMRKGAKVTGDVSCPNLIVEEGVFFQGHSSMGAVTAEGLEVVAGGKPRDGQGKSGDADELRHMVQ